MDQLWTRGVALTPQGDELLEICDGLHPAAGAGRPRSGISGRPAREHAARSQVRRRHEQPLVRLHRLGGTPEQIKKYFPNLAAAR
jgi:hypothetical protein